MELGLDQHVEKINEISGAATKELSIELVGKQAHGLSLGQGRTQPVLEAQTPRGLAEQRPGGPQLCTPAFQFSIAVSASIVICHAS